MVPELAKVGPMIRIDPRTIDRSGQRYGRLLVLRPAPSVNYQSRWLCRCDCGVEKIVLSTLLARGTSASCGCIKKEISSARWRTHGRSKTKEHIVWTSMKSRIFNPKNKRYKHYGCRGITICDRWLDSFENFLADMGPRPSGHTLERIDNDGNYEPSNCKWATTKEQTRNYRRNKIVVVRGKSMPLISAVEMLGLNYARVQGRLRLGWTEEEALEIVAR